MTRSYTARQSTVLSVATAAQWQRGRPALDRKVKQGMRVQDRTRRAGRLVVGPSSTPPTTRSIQSASTRSPPNEPLHAAALGPMRRVFLQRRESSFRSIKKGGDVSRAMHDRPVSGQLVCAGPIPNRGEPVLPATRRFQVEREWCPMILAGSRTWLATACQVVRNTYQSIDTPCAT